MSSISGHGNVRVGTWQDNRLLDCVTLCEMGWMIVMIMSSVGKSFLPSLREAQCMALNKAIRNLYDKSVSCALST